MGPVYSYLNNIISLVLQIWPRKTCWKLSPLDFESGALLKESGWFGAKKPFLFHLYVFSFFSLEGSNLSRRHSQAIISGGLFHRTAGDFVELRLKAWNSRIMTAFLTVCLDNVLKNIPAADRTPALKLTTATMHSMSTWMLRLEGADKRLSAEDAQWLWDEGNRCLALSWFLYNAMCLMSFS